MAEYLSRRLNKKVNVILEDNSLSTIENIKLTKRLVSLGNGDEVVVFCDNVRPPKVMWFVLHFWFKLTRSEIEKYFLNYSIKHYKKHYTTEMIGGEIASGMRYENVNVVPYRWRTEINDAVSAQIASIMEILSLYDNRLEKELKRAIRVKFGME